MKTDNFRLPSSVRQTISKWLSVTLTTLLSLQAVGLTAVASRRAGPAPRSSSSPSPLVPQGETIVVNRTGDEDNPNPNQGCDVQVTAPGAQCTLRAAIQRANFLGGADININIPATAPGCDAATGACVVRLTKELPALSTGSGIYGPGADKLTVRRETGGDYGIFTVTANNEATLSELRIENGKPAGGAAGSAVRNVNLGTVNIAACVIDNNESNSGGVISNESGGTINVRNSLVSNNRATGNGAGISNYGGGTVNVTGSAVYSNTVNVPTVSGSSGGGAGIYNAVFGTVNVINSIISQNRVQAGHASSVMKGGGIWNAGTGAVRVTNSVIYNNSVSNGAATVGNGGGAANDSGELTILNSTISYNTAAAQGGGISGTANVKSSLIAKNQAGALQGPSDVSGTFHTEGYNLVGATTGGASFNGPKDQAGTTADPIDPRFDTNPVTITILGGSFQLPLLPLCNSLAIDAGANTGSSFDLRGAGSARTVDSPDKPNAADGTDTGAFEQQTLCSQSVFTVNTTGDAGDANVGDHVCDSDAGAPGAQCTLRAAIMEVNDKVADYLIDFAIPATDPGYDPAAGRHTIKLTGALPDILNDLVMIKGPGADKLTVRRETGGFYPIFTFDRVDRATLSGMTVSNGFTQGNGGGVSFKGRNLNVQACAFTGNNAGRSGGGIYADSGLNVSDSTFSNNFAGSASTLTGEGGGGIYVKGAFSVNNSHFNSNLANAVGGGINSNGTGTTSRVTDSTFDGNGADDGGGLFTGGSVGTSTVSVINCVFRNNSSTITNAQGGGIYQLIGTLNITDSTISGNEGHGLSVAASIPNTTNINGSTFSANIGSGIFMEPAGSTPVAKLNVINSTISGNKSSANYNGYGINLYRAALNISNSTISYNEDAGIARVIAPPNLGTWTIKSSIIALNGGNRDVSGDFTSAGFNLVGKRDGSTGFTQPTDQTGTIAAPLDPRFDPAGLKKNGGPTETIALRPDSPAIDAGTSDTVFALTDQRGIGFKRIYDDQTVANVAGGNGTDIGAFERSPVSVLQFSANSYSVNENAGAATITVTREGSTSGAVSVRYTTPYGSATPGVDYTTPDGILFFGDGETTKSFTIPIINDDAKEADEQIVVALIVETGPATLGLHSTAALTILDDDSATPTPTPTPTPAPTPASVLQLSAAASSVNENAGTATVTVTRSGSTSTAVTVNYATANGTAVAGADYVPTIGTLSFASGETIKSVSIPIINDSAKEADETFEITLNDLTGNATMGTPSTAELTIKDDDPQPTVSINDVAVPEGDSGTTDASFSVNLSAPTFQAVTVNYATADGTADAAGDYSAASGTLTFNPGETFKTVSVTLKPDTVTEADETFFVSLSSPTNATINDGQGTGTILNDDATLLQFGTQTYSGAEDAGHLEVVVTRTGDTSGAASVEYQTSDQSGLTPCQAVTGMASERCDYATAAGTLTFAPGEQQKAIQLVLVDDAYVEGPETLSLKLGNPQGADLGSTDTATVTILDNDTQPAAQNPIPDPAFFVRQQYIDFLGREPEPAGLAAWLNILNNCGTQVQMPCDRVEVSSGFSRSPEFQQRGYFIYRFYAAALGRLPHYSEFIPDMARVSGFLSPQELEAARVGFLQGFMQRAEFKTKFDPTLSDPDSYVNLLEQTAGVSLANRQALVTGLQNATETRATVLRKVIESPEVAAKFLNEAFVVEAYFGYLRRDPDILYLQWIETLKQTGDYRTLVSGFMNSVEYVRRFGP